MFHSDSVFKLTLPWYIELFISDASGCMRMFVFLVLKKTVASYFSDGFSSDSGFSMRFIVTENPINKRAPFM